MPRWFRHYAGLCRDEKLCAVARAAGQSIERVVWLFGVILEDAAERNDGGRFEIDVGALAWFLHCEASELESIMAALKRGGRIDGGRVSQWGVRQFASDQSTDRVRTHRNRQRNGAAVMP